MANPILSGLYSNENLVCTADAADKNIYNWYKDGISIQALNMPFEAGSTTKDYSGNGNNGTNNGAAWGASSGHDGKGAYYFDGVNDYINVGNPTSLNNFNQITISLWVKPDSTTQWIDVLSKETGDYSNSGYGIRQSASNNIAFAIRTYTKQEIISNTTYDIGVWNHIVGVYDGSLMTLYKNGVNIGTAYRSGSITNSSNNLNIGRRTSAGDRNFKGYIDDVKIFDIALSAEQVSNLANNNPHILSSEDTTVGDSWLCKVTPNNGSLDGTEVSSNAVVVANILPVAEEIDVTTTLNATSVLTEAEILEYVTDTDSLTITSVQDATNGSVVLDNGVITYTPDIDFVGNGVYTYTATDEHGGEATATVTVVVTNDCGVTTQAQYHLYLDNYLPLTNLISTVNSIETKIDELNDFDPDNDTVANVTTVDVTTTNTDMRGTDWANTVTPDNSQFTSSDRTKLEALENYDDTSLTAVINALNNITAADVWASASRALTDKTSFALTTAEHALIATKVEQSILDEGDGEQVLNAIVGAIGNTNVDQVALIAAIRADLERTNGKLYNIENDTNELQTNQSGWTTATGFATPANVTSSQAAVVAEINANETKIDALNNITAADVWASASRSLTDKVGFALTTAEHSLIADSIDTDALIADIREDLERTNGKLHNIENDTSELQSNQDGWTTATGFATPANVTNAQTAIVTEINANEAKIDAIDTSLVAGELHTALDSYTNKDDYKADLTPVLTAIGELNNISLSDIEGSTDLAMADKLQEVATAIALIPTTDNIADLTPVLTAIGNLNNVTPAQVRAAFDEAEFKDKNTEIEIHAWLDNYTNKDDYKADVSSLSNDVNVVQVNGVIVDSVEDFKADVSNIADDILDEECQ